LISNQLNTKINVKCTDVSEEGRIAISTEDIMTTGGSLQQGSNMTSY